MSVILILIICSLLVAGGFLIGFLWSVKTGQFDDDISPAVRILFDDETAPNSIENKLKNPDKV